MHSSKVSQDLLGRANEKVTYQEHLIDTDLLEDEFLQWKGSPEALLEHFGETLNQPSPLRIPLPNQPTLAKSLFALVAIDPASYPSFHPQRNDLHKPENKASGSLDSSTGYQFYLIDLLCPEKLSTSKDDSVLAQLQIFSPNDKESAFRLLTKLKAEQPRNFEKLKRQLVADDKGNFATSDGTSQESQDKGHFALVFLDALEFAALFLPDAVSSAVLSGIVHITRPIVKLFVKEPKSQIFNCIEKIADVLPENFQNPVKAINLLAKEFYPYQVELRSANLRNGALRDASLVGANLPGTSLSGLDLRNINFTHANLQGANLSCTDLRGALLQGANLALHNWSMSQG